MNRKHKILSAVLVCALLVAGIITANNLYTIAERSSKQYTHADWNEHFATDKDLIESSDLIVKGKVIDSYCEKRYDVVFTKQVIEVSKILKGKINSNEQIEILQTGGELDNIKTPVIKEAPLLDKNGTYLLMLRKTDEGHYLLMGGYQGVGKIIKNTLVFSKEQKDIFKGLDNKDITYVEVTIENLAK